MSFDTTHANQERIKCACPRLDARDCYRWRHGIDLREMIDGTDPYHDDDDDVCQCGCHEPDVDENGEAL